jgi:hypothetical protein
MSTPNGQRYELHTTRSMVIDCFAKLTGGGVGVDLVNSDSTIPGGGEITSAVWASTGTYTVTFAKAWSQLEFAPIASFVGGTADFNMQVSAIDVTARTATFVFNSGTTPTDVPTTTTVYVRWAVRPTNKN